MFLKNQFVFIGVIMIAAACHQPAAEKVVVKGSPELTVIEPTREGVTDTVKKSIPAVAINKVNGVEIVIRYHSPAVRNRVIWGGLVPYDEVWVTGAHTATSFESEKDLSINGKKIAAGKYALFTIPGSNEWTIIINKNWDQHLADEYNASDDIVRVTLSPEAAAHQERLMYTIDQTGERKFNIEIRWAKVRLRLPVQIL